MIFELVLFAHRDDFPDALPRAQVSSLRARITEPALALDFDRVLARHRASFRSLVERDGETWISAWDLRAALTWIAATRRIELAEMARYFAPGDVP